MHLTGIPRAFSRRGLVVAVIVAGVMSGSVVAVSGAVDLGRLPISQTEPESPVTAAHFGLVIDGSVVAQFLEMQRLESEVVPTQRGRALGTPAPPVLVLRRQLTRDVAISAWHEAVRQNGRHERKEVTLVAYGTDGEPEVAWTLSDAWPSKLEINGIRAGSSEVLMETVTFTASDVRRVVPAE